MSQIAGSIPCVYEAEGEASVGRRRAAEQRETETAGADISLA